MLEWVIFYQYNASIDGLLQDYNDIRKAVLNDEIYRRQLVDS